MDGSPVLWQLLILGVLLVLSVLTAIIETALVSLSKIRLRHLLELGVERAKTIERILEHPERLFTAVLVGNILVNNAATALATGLAIVFFGAKGAVVAAAIITLLVIVGEITSKTYAAKYPEKVSLFFARPVEILIFILTPVVRISSVLTGIIMRLIGEKDTGVKPYITEDEIKMMVSVGAEEGVVEGSEKEMIHCIFNFNDLIVREVMTPRIDITAVSLSATIDDILDTFKESNYSRLPVYDGNIDNIVGIIYIKDIFFASKQQDIQLTNLIRKAHYIPEGKKVVDLFREFQQLKIHMAIIMDEYSGTAGLVTLEDLLEEIVGQIQDEYDDEKSMLVRIDEHTVVVDARMNVDELNKLLDLNIVVEEEYDTVGGFIVAKLGKIPVEGEKFCVDDIEITVQEIDGHKIEKVKIAV